MAASALSTGYDIEIIEAHHRHKVTRPRHRAEDGRGDRRRPGARPEGLRRLRARASPASAIRPAIGFATIRGGDIVGDHTALFAGTGERIEISHKSSSHRVRLLAQGSLRAPRFLAAGARRPVRHGRRAGPAVNRRIFANRKCEPVARFLRRATPSAAPVAILRAAADVHPPAGW